MTLDAHKVLTTEQVMSYAQCHYFFGQELEGQPCDKRRYKKRAFVTIVLWHFYVCERPPRRLRPISDPELVCDDGLARGGL